MKELHIYELLKILTKTIRREHKNEVFNRFIEASELFKLDEKRTPIKKLKPSNHFTGIKPKRFGIRIRKLLYYILIFNSKYVHFIKSCCRSEINTHYNTFLENIIQGDDIINFFIIFFGQLSKILQVFFNVLQNLHCFLTYNCCQSLFLNIKNKPKSTPYPRTSLLTNLNCFPKASPD